MNQSVTVLVILLLAVSCLDADEIPGPVASALNQHCADCHTGPSSKGGLDLATLTFNLDDRKVRDRWVLIHESDQERRDATRFRRSPCFRAAGNYQRLTRACRQGRSR